MNDGATACPAGSVVLMIVYSFAFLVLRTRVGSPGAARRGPGSWADGKRRWSPGPYSTCNPRDPCPATRRGTRN